MIKFLLALALLWAPAAHAQNTMCSTRAPGDNSNACASTAFVIAGFASGLPSATTSQLYGGSGAAGTAVVISLGTHLSITTSTLGTDALGTGILATRGDLSLALPSGTTCQPYGGSGAAGTAQLMTLGTGLSCTGGTLNVSALTGPGSSTSNGIVTWNGTGGTAVLSPPNATVDSSGNGSFAGLAASGTLSGTGFNGTWRLLNTLTASNSANLQDTTSLTATYREYDIYLDNILPATSGTTCEILVQESSTFPASSYVNGGQFSNSSGQAGSTGVTTYIPCSAPSEILNSGAGVSGHIHISNPSQTASPKWWYGDFISGSSSGHVANLILVGGDWNGGNNAITGFEVVMASGNITSGIVYVYGHN